MKLVREMKKYGHIRVANAMYSVGRWWRNPRRIPTNIEHMVMGVPRIELEQILNILRRDWPTLVPNVTPTSQDFVEILK